MRMGALMQRHSLVIGLLLCSFSAVAQAQDQTRDAGLVDASSVSVAAPRTHDELATHPDFRVRVQAAEILGETRGASERVLLEGALADRHPAVRAAAVVSLGKIGAPESIAPLRRLRMRDPSAAVRNQCDRAIRAIGDAPRSRASANLPTSWRGVRYVLILGEVRDRAQVTATQESHDYAAVLREALASEIMRAPDFFLSTAMSTALATEASRRRVPLYRLDATVNTVEMRVTGTDVYARSEIRLILEDAASSAMRGTVSGAASSTESNQDTAGQRQRLVARTLGASVRSALAQLPAALAPRRSIATARPRRR